MNRYEAQTSPKPPLSQHEWWITEDGLFLYRVDEDLGHGIINMTQFHLNVPEVGGLATKAIALEYLEKYCNKINEETARVHLKGWDEQIFD